MRLSQPITIWVQPTRRGPWRSAPALIIREQPAEGHQVVVVGLDGRRHLRSGGRSGCRRGGGLGREVLDPVDQRADGDLVAVAEAGLLDDVAVDPQAVLAAQVADRQAAVGDREAAVAARDPGQVQADIALGVAADE